MFVWGICDFTNPKVDVGLKGVFENLHVGFSIHISQFMKIVYEKYFLRKRCLAQKKVRKAFLT